MNANAQEKMNRSYETKVMEATGLIAKNVHTYPGRCVIGWSGGRNSMVLLDMALRIDRNINVVFNDTGVEFPQTLQFVERIANEWNLNLTIGRPTDLRLKRGRNGKPDRWLPPRYTNYWQVVEAFGFANGSKNPTARMTPEEKKGAHAGKRCCYWLKESVMDNVVRTNEWEAVFDGTTAAENHQRYMRAVTHGACFYYKSGNYQKVKPTLWFRDVDVERYHVENNLPRNQMYDEGSVRVGCMTCTAFKRWEAEMFRLTPKLHTLIRGRMGEPASIQEGDFGPCKLNGDRLDARDQERQMELVIC